MARRGIGQEQLAIVGDRPRGDTSLDEMRRLVDWTEIDQLLVGISAALTRTGCSTTMAPVTTHAAPPGGA